MGFEGVLVHTSMALPIVASFRHGAKRFLRRPTGESRQRLGFADPR